MSDSHKDFFIPPGQYGGLWRKRIYSDVLIRLTCTATSPGTVYREIPGHKMVLEEGSSYFQGQFTIGLELSGQPAAKKAKIETAVAGQEASGQYTAVGALVAVQSSAAQQVVDIPCDNEEAATVMESVLSFIYSNTLPASPTADMLYKIMMTADYLGADLCVKACGIALCKAKLDKSSLTHITEICDAVRRCSACNPVILERVQSVFSGYLANVYGNVPCIIKNNEKQLGFCKLPLDAVGGWGKNANICVDSENSVVVLLNQWWHSQPEHMQTEECKKKLSSLVKPARLSCNYLQYALERLEWYIPPFPDYKLAATLVNTRSIEELHMDSHLIKTLAVGSRPQIKEAFSLALCWQLSLKMIEEAVNCKTNHVLDGPSGYWKGHIWSLYLRGSHDADAKVINITLGVRLLAANKMPQGIPATAQIKSWNSPFYHSGDYAVFTSSEDWCVHARCLEDALSSKFDSNGQLPVHVHISDMQ